MTQTAIIDRVKSDRNEFPFTTEFVTQLVTEGKATALFQLSLEYARSFNEFPEGWTPEKCEASRQNVIEAVKRQIGEAIEATQTHCGQPLTVRGVYDAGKQRHGLLVRCSHCGRIALIQEQNGQIH